VGGEILYQSRPAQGPHSLLYCGYLVSFPGLKWPWHGVDTHSVRCWRWMKSGVIFLLQSLCLRGML